MTIFEIPIVVYGAKDFKVCDIFSFFDWSAVLYADIFFRVPKMILIFNVNFDAHDYLFSSLRTVPPF